MMSKNSFWVNIKENQKRRIWVWIVAALLQIVNYLGVLMIYITRIRKWHEEGAYETEKLYKEALYDAARDALAFGQYQWLIVGVLATIIALQGFSYLYDCRKVDLYHSVPVSRKRRFFVIYLGGIGIYLLTTCAALLVGNVTAAAMGALNGQVMAAAALGFAWNLFFFLILYHTMILSVMLTGNWFVTLLVYLFLNLYEVVIYEIWYEYENHFFRTVSTFYTERKPKLSAIYDYFSMNYQLKSNGKDLALITKMILPYCGKWIMIAVGLLAAAYLLYRARASEAAGRAMAYRKAEPVLKVAGAIPAAALVGLVIYEASYSSVLLMAAGMGISGVLFCFVMEIMYDFDLRSAFRHMISTAVAFIGILAVFFIFDQDLVGYDKYVPDADQVESVAVSLSDEYTDYYEEIESGMRYVSMSDYQREHMFLHNIEPVLALAEKSLNEEDWSQMKDGRSINVLYRLKNGRQVGRCFQVDLDNPSNEEYLNAIIGSQEYKEGIYQTMTEDAIYERVGKIIYTNGVTEIAVPAGEAAELKEQWNEDMRQMDFTDLRENLPCGSIQMNFQSSYMTVQLPVYESFAHTISYLKERGAYYPVQLSAEDIESVSITNYHHELYDNAEAGMGMPEARAATTYDYYEDRSVVKEFSDQEEIAEILQCIYPAYDMNTTWNSSEAMDQNYDVQIMFRMDSAYPYRRGAYYFSYQFIGGRVPEFVEKATAVQ